MRRILWAVFHPVKMLEALDEAEVSRDVWKGRAMEAIQRLAVAGYPLGWLKAAMREVAKGSGGKP